MRALRKCVQARPGRLAGCRGRPCDGTGGVPRLWQRNSAELQRCRDGEMPSFRGIRHPPLPIRRLSGTGDPPAPARHDRGVLSKRCRRKSGCWNRQYSFPDEAKRRHRPGGRGLPSGPDRVPAELIEPYQPPWWYEIRAGGQYVKITGPIRLLLGTAPQERESHESGRLSPTMKYSPSGTFQVCPK